MPWPKGDGVIVKLQSRGYNIANMAHFGEEVQQMLGLDDRQELALRLGDPNVNYDALLFSGGGNDLVGDKFCVWLHDTSARTASFKDVE